MMKKVLFIIDVQNGFSDDGDLPVIGAQKLANNIDKYIKDENPDVIVMTGDYHPENHISFKEYGGEWPAHCIENTDSVKPIRPLGKYLNDERSILLKKGCDPNREEFSALISKDNVLDLHSFLVDKDIIHKGDFEDEYFLNDNVEYIFTGLVLEICVAENARSFNYYRNLFNKGGFTDKLEIHKELVASLKFGDKIDKYIDRLTKTDLI